MYTALRIIHLCVKPFALCLWSTSRRRYDKGNELDKMLTQVVAMKREMEENSVMN